MQLLPGLSQISGLVFYGICRERCEMIDASGTKNSESSMLTHSISDQSSTNSYQKVLLTSSCFPVYTKNTYSEFCLKTYCILPSINSLMLPLDSTWNLAAILSPSNLLMDKFIVVFYTLFRLTQWMMLLSVSAIFSSGESCSPLKKRTSRQPGAFIFQEMVLRICWYSTSLLTLTRWARFWLLLRYTLTQDWSYELVGVLPQEVIRVINIIGTKKINCSRTTSKKSIQTFFQRSKRVHWADLILNAKIGIQSLSKMTKQMVIPIILLFLCSLAASSPLMIEQKDEFLEKVKTKNIAILFYGNAESQQFLAFSNVIPTTNHLYSGIEFFHVPSNKFKLNRPIPSISIYRKIGSGDWTLYHGAFSPQDIDRWIKRNIFQHLPEINIEELDRILMENSRAFLLLDFGEFELIRSKIYLQEFCEFQKIKCFKLSALSNPLLNVGMKTMGLGKADRGISKLALYNPHTERLELYSKDLWFMTREDLLQMYEGQTGIIASDQYDHFAGDLQIQLHYEDTTL